MAPTAAPLSFAPLSDYVGSYDPGRLNSYVGSDEMFLELLVRRVAFWESFWFRFPGLLWLIVLSFLAMAWLLDEVVDDSTRTHSKLKQGSESTGPVGGLDSIKRDFAENRQRFRDAVNELDSARSSFPNIPSGFPRRFGTLQRSLAPAASSFVGEDAHSSDGRG